MRPPRLALLMAVGLVVAGSLAASISSAASQVPLASSRPAPGAATSLCFEFVGAQDKPMPEFCIEAAATVPPGSAQAATADESRLFVGAPALRRIVERCLAPAGPGVDGSGTAYRCRANAGSGGKAGEIDAAAMQWVVSELQADYAARKLQAPRVLDVLRRRLGG